MTFFLYFIQFYNGKHLFLYTFIHRQCNNEEAIQLREKCNNKLKVLLGECLNETEIEAFSKIENIAQRVYDVICSIDEEKMKSK